MLLAVQPGVVRSVVMHYVCALVSALMLFVAACATETQPVTQLVLVADTDIAELDSVTFVMTSPDGEERVAVGSIAAGAPAFVSMTKGSDAELGPYRIEVRGLSDGSVLVSRSALVSFVADSTRTVLLHLARACRPAPACPDNEVCALGVCRAELVAADELLPWSGRPPTLMASDSLDGGLPDADAADQDGALDASSMEPDATPLPDDAAVDGGDGGDAGGCASAPTCRGDLLEVCSNGVVTGVMACTASADPCNRNACVAGQGCVPVPVATNAMCGPGLTCSNGVCGSGQSCSGPMCNPTCNAGVSSCALQCSTGGQDCNPSCPGGSSCDVLCQNASNCNPTCSGRCDVTCAASSNCRTTCQSGSTCDIDCTGNNNCDKTNCASGASCILRCGTTSSCKFDKCPGASVTNCGNGVYTCRAPCPT